MVGKVVARAVKIPILVNYGFVVFFVSIAALNTVAHGAFLIVESGMLTLWALLLIACSFLKEAQFKMVQTLFLAALGYFFVLTNPISEYSGLLLLTCVLIMAWQYGYLRKRVFFKAALSMILLIVSAAVAGYNLLNATAWAWEERNMLFEILAHAILFSTILYQLAVLVFLPALRTAQRNSELSRLVDLQAAYYLMAEEDDNTVVETGKLDEEGFFFLDDEEEHRAMIGFSHNEALGATIHKNPDHFISLSRQEILRLVARMRLLERIDDESLARLRREGYPGEMPSV